MTILGVVVAVGALLYLYLAFRPRSGTWEDLRELSLRYSDIADDLAPLKFQGPIEWSENKYLYRRRVLITSTVDPDAVRRWLNADGEPTRFRAVTADPAEKALDGKECLGFIHDPGPGRHYEIHVFPDGMIRVAAFRGPPDRG